MTLLELIFISMQEGDVVAISEEWVENDGSIDMASEYGIDVMIDGKMVIFKRGDL